MTKKFSTHFETDVTGSFPKGYLVADGVDNPSDADIEDMHSQGIHGWQCAKKLPRGRRVSYCDDAPEPESPKCNNVLASIGAVLVAIPVLVIGGIILVQALR